MREFRGGSLELLSLRQPLATRGQMGGLDQRGKNAFRNVPECHKADASYEEEVERRKMGADSIK